MFLRITAALLFITLVAACQPGSSSSEHPVFTEVRNNDPTGLMRFLAEGGDPNLVNSDGDTLLYVASGARGGLEVVEVLLLAGADTAKLSREKRTPLHTAAAWCNDRIVVALLNAGASFRVQNGEGETPPQVVCAQPYERRDQVLALFFEAGWSE